MKTIVLCTLSVLLLAQVSAFITTGPVVLEQRNAVCTVMANPSMAGSGNNVNGVISLYQERTAGGIGPLQFTFSLQGFAMTTTNMHGFHAHSLNDFSNGCDSTGGHFNPQNVNHGSPVSAVRHVGDFGNIQVTNEGRVRAVMHDPVANIFGEDIFSIAGRPLVIHLNPDDLGAGGNTGSETTGNAGGRLACCLVQPFNP